MSSAEKNRWTTLSVRNVYENAWIRLEEFQVINPSGGHGIYGKVHFKNIAIGVIPVDDQGNTWLVGQWRYPLNQWSWEIPEGGGSHDDDPSLSARRELQEETGLIAGKCSLIQHAHLSNSVTDEAGMIFLAEDLTAGEARPEETEADMKVWKLKLSDAINMVLDGAITDSLSVMGLLKVARLKRL